MRSRLFRRCIVRSVLAVTLALILAQFASQTSLPAAAAPDSPLSASVSLRFEGPLVAFSPDKWVVGQTAFLVDKNTIVNAKRAPAEVGAWLVVFARRTAEDVLLAEYIFVESAAGEPGELYQFTGVLEKRPGVLWSVSQIVVEVPDAVRPPEDPAVGALLSVVAEMTATGLRAVAIEVIAAPPDAVPVEYEGTIQKVEPGMILVEGRWIIVDPKDIEGSPEVGLDAEVRALLGPDAFLHGQRVRIVEPLSETGVQGLITGLTRAADGSQQWELVVFPEEAGAAPESAQLSIGPDAFVDQSRATLGVGLWVEVQGSKVGQSQYRAEMIRLDMPAPVTLQGPLMRREQAGDGWWEIDGQPIWLSTPEVAATASGFTGKTASVTGYRLGNGVVWAGRVESGRSRSP